MAKFIGTLSRAIARGWVALRDGENKLSDAAAKILTEAESIEVLALEPEPTEAKGAFHGYKIHGSAAVKGAAKKEFIAAFEKGLEDLIDRARCFIPRHGIRAALDGKSVDLVICFECHQFKVYTGTDAKGRMLLVNDTPLKAFEKALRDAVIEKRK
jgi:hypothetical protein